MLTRAHMKAAEDAPEETRWMLKVPTLSGGPTTTYARNFALVGILTAVVAAVGAWLLTRDWARSAEVTAIAVTLHLLRYMIPLWAWTAAAAVGGGVMMWLLGGGVVLIIWAVSAAPIIWFIETRRRNDRAGM